MQRSFKVLGLAMVITAILVFALAGTVLAGDNGYMEPAPNAGLDLHDGSGFELDDVGSGLAGPAPNAGDGIHDGSGF